MGAIYIIWLRNLKRFWRSKSRVIGSLGMPVFFLIILGFGLSSVLTIPGMGHDYMKFIIPGIIAMTVLFSSIFAGIQVIWDKQFGFLKEMLVAPVSRISLMIGQTLGGATTSLIQGMLILIVGLFIAGFVSSILGFLIAIAFMVLIGISFTALGIAFASKMKDMHGFQLIMNFFIFPVFGLSGALFPISNAPNVLKIIAYFDPLTYGVEGIRYGLLGVSQINPWISFVILLGFSIAMILLGGFLFRKVKI
ncbi:multidrug ABC transporter permease [Candidatus Pacearchaeota archaeon CG1_02_31_27]|nr:MAG: multidrug ABC transporter permease [Candidatus Pacearchaeota archaeon CG1_02_31_27]PIZ81030.1 MAG: multidrug ABC transporter permease [Candidatus Pacearchaeota archaeon CG_4_10_14_0_2_um_filter_31_10]